ncbi:MAG TPA: hypothetical protein VIJ64_01060 [Candidatus Lustribacter sp.]
MRRYRLGRDRGVTVFIAVIALAVVLLMIGLEIAVSRSRNRPPRRSAHRHARRQPLLEDRLRDALDEPHSQYGEIFTSYMIWKRDRATRMELCSGGPWLDLNEFTRALVVRQIWRALEKLATGSVVAVDAPPQEWSAQVDASFDDRGIDPWAEKVQAAGC